MNLTGTVLTVTIESVVLVAVGMALNIAGVRDVPDWLTDDVARVLIVVFFTTNVIALTMAIIGAPMPSPRLPNLAQTVRSRVFPAPAAYRYTARTQRVKP